MKSTTKTQRKQTSHVLYGSQTSDRATEASFLLSAFCIVFQKKVAAFLITLVQKHVSIITLYLHNLERRFWVWTWIREREDVRRRYFSMELRIGLVWKIYAPVNLILSLISTEKLDHAFSFVLIVLYMSQHQVIWYGDSTGLC